MAAGSTSRAGVSPSSSPRLPSPPPFTEVQFGPTSPSIGGSIQELRLEAAGSQDDGASRRIRPGTKAVDMAKGPPFVPLHQLESPFQLQEYLQALHHKLTRDDKSNTVNPITKEMAVELATPPTAQDSGEVVDRNLWLYELCRFLCSKTTRIIVAFFADNPPCSSQTCPEMRASEWQYLCAVHEPPKSCCAIDYCNHTLDWASNVLTSTKHFPSRLSLGGDGVNTHQSMRQLTNIFRRVYRIYAHAWFQHREVFWTIEAELGLYMFFKTVCDAYQLIPEDNYTIPPEAEGERTREVDMPITLSSPQRVQVLQRDSEAPNPPTGEQSPASTNVSTGATTRRHKHTPSTGVPIAVIAEGAEEEEETSASAKVPLSPTKSSLADRRSSPRHIELPDNTDAEQAPEDPTPLASHGTNPLEANTSLDSPGPAISSPTNGTFHTEEYDPFRSSGLHRSNTVLDHSAEARTTQTKHDVDSGIVISPTTTATDGITSTLRSVDKPDHPDAEHEHDQPEDAGNETMERIDISLAPALAPTSATSVNSTQVSSDTSKTTKSDDSAPTATTPVTDPTLITTDAHYSNSDAERQKDDSKIEQTEKEDETILISSATTST